MAEWFWACPGCGQQQRAQTQQGEAREVTLCASCEEEAEAKREAERFAKGETLTGKKHR